MPKVAKNLLLDEDAVAAGERYSAAHGTTLSRLVSDFLRRLPPAAGGGAPPDIKSPAVRRLYGIAARSDIDERDYHEYLYRKYVGGE